MPVDVLVSPINRLTFLGTPVVDRDFVVQALAAMLDGIAADPHLPKILCANDMTAGSAVHSALNDVLARRGAPAIMLECRRRARLETSLDGKPYLERNLSSERRRKMRQLGRQLGTQGQLDLTVHSEPSEVRSVFQEFLALEAAGWKGQRHKRGKAIGLDSEVAVFAREMVSGLAAEGLARIYALRLGGRPAAMGIILYSGHVAFTWKTTYDEELRRFGPGILLMEDVTKALLADPDVTIADSCNRGETGFQAGFWSERQDIVDLLVDVRPGSSAGFRLLGAAEHFHRGLKHEARRAYRVGKNSLALGRAQASQLGSALRKVARVRRITG